MSYPVSLNLHLYPSFSLLQALLTPKLIPTPSHQSTDCITSSTPDHCLLRLLRGPDLKSKHGPLPKNSLRAESRRPHSQDLRAVSCIAATERQTS